MKFALFAILPVCFAGRFGLSSQRSLKSLSVAMAKAKSKVTPEDISMCMEHATQFISGEMLPARLIEAAQDHCAMSKQIGDKNYVCPHFQEGLEGAFSTQPADRKFNAENFCWLAETYFIELRGAARVPNMGSGPLINFHIADSCNPAVTSAFSPDTALSTEHVPDFWYAMCVNQDCAHFLPSRTRWCDVERDPTHSIVVCDALRTFAKDETSVLGSGDMTPDEVCDVYGEFVKEMGINVEAYEHVMHKDTRHKMPIPDDHLRALQSANMVNEAQGHALRDGAGSQVQPVHARSEAYSVVPFGLLALTLLVTC